MRKGVRVALLVVVPALCACNTPLEQIDDSIADGRYEEAQKLARARVERLTQRGETDGIEMGRTLDRLVLAMYRDGQAGLPETRTLAERALTIKQALLENDDPELAPSLDNLGALTSFRGDLDGARVFHEKALAIREAAFGPESYEVSLTLNYLAPTLYLMGDYAAASPLLERALAIRKQQLGPEHPRVAGVLHNLGLLAYDMGDDATARRYYERALQIHEAAHPNHPQVANALNNLAYVAMRGEDYEEAMRLATRALEIKERVLSPQDSDIADTLDLLGNIEHARGNYEAAQQYYERAIEIFRQSMPPDHPSIALSRFGLAGTLHELGHLEASKQLFADAAAIWAEKLSDTHPYTAASRRGLAAVLLDLGETEECLRTALAAEASSREHLRLTSRAFAEGSSLRYASVRVSGLDLALSLAADGRVAQPDAIADALIRSRALVFDEMAARRRMLRDAKTPAIQALRERLTDARSRLANLMVRGVVGDPSRYASQLEKAREAAQRAEEELARASAPFREELALGDAGLQEVLASLPPNSALVAFARYTHHEPGGAEATSAYVAMVIRHGGGLVAEPLGEAEPIERLISEWRGEVALTASVAGDLEAAEQAYLRSATALRKRVWDPLAPLLGSARLVFVVPDGALNTVNLATLPTGGKSFLIETGPLIHYLSAERDLLLPHMPDRLGSGMLAFGNPDFDATETAAAATVAAGGARLRNSGSYCGAMDSIHFSPLPETDREVREIGRAWAHDANQEFSLATGREAAESRFKHDAPGRRVIHLATHGFFLNGQCSSRLAGTRGLSLSGPPVTVPPSRRDNNPLVLAGLAFAGANDRVAPADGGEDGVLTAEEIMSLDLTGVEWVVLSACDTGLGEIHDGEGVLGLRRAFRLAGARTLIMSLWSVDDTSTRQWMGQLYTARLAGESTVSAMQQASRAIVERRRQAGESTHPFFWGAFVATGGWS